MEMVSGSVVYEASDPKDFGYGLRFNVAVRPDDPDAPHVNDDGLIRVWASVGKPDAEHLQTLTSGDDVQLVWQTRGDKGWYSVVVPSSKAKAKDVKPEPKPEPEPENVEDGRYEEAYRSMRIYIPLNVEQILVYTEVAKQNIDLLLHVYRLTAQGIEDSGLDIDQEIVWKMAVTAFINTNKEYRRDMVMLDTESPF